MERVPSFANLLRYHRLRRKDLQHHIFYLTLQGKLGLAPNIQPGNQVGRALDLGTGTGIWAMDFGDEHPEAEVRSLLATS